MVGKGRPIKTLLLWLTLFHLAAAAALAVAPDLHEQVHCEASHEDHSCAITALIHGGWQSLPVLPVTLGLPPEPVASIAPCDRPEPLPASTLGPLRGRAPPALS